MEEVIEIDYKPRNWSLELHESAKRWIVAVLHRRAGKTTAALNHLQRSAITIPQSNWAYIAPTYKQAKRIAWKIIKNASSAVPGIKYNEAELKIIYPNGSELVLYGADNPDSLRGLALWGVVFDEYSQQNPEIFSEIITKCLADHLGYAIFIGTFKGKNHFYRLYEEAKKDIAWTAIFKTIDDSFANEEGQVIENLKVALEDDRKLVAQGLMTQEEFDQEWYCAAEAAVKGAYYAKELSEARKSKRITSVPYDKVLLVHTVWDLGVGQNIAVGFYQGVGRERHMIDFWKGKESEGIADAIAVVKNKGYIYGKHFAPHDAEGREISTGKTRVEFAETFQIKFDIVKKIPVDDGINAGRLLFQRLWIDEQKCQYFIDSISQYRQEWDEDRGMFTEKPYHDWTCFAGDTKVLTHSGIRPIMELLSSHKVLTLKGWQEQTGSRITKRNVPVVEVRFKDATKVRCTPDHLFLTDKGWKSAKDLTKGSLIQSSLTISRSILMVSCTVYGLMKSIFLVVAKDYIGQFGKELLGKFLKDVISIIKTVIQPTTDWRTLNLSIVQNIFPYLGQRIIPQRVFQRKQDREQQSGISLQREDFGTREWQSVLNHGKSGKEQRENVYSVKQSLIVLLEAMGTLKNTVIQIVKPLIIEDVKELLDREDVWDICVPKEHQFSLSNGAVVHNSHGADVHRYAAIVAEEMDNGEQETDRRIMENRLQRQVSDAGI